MTQLNPAMNKQQKHPKVPIELYLGLPGEPGFEHARHGLLDVAADLSREGSSIRRAFRSFAHRVRDTY